MIGESDIILNRERQDNYVALTDCYLLRYERYYFEEILEKFPDIRKEVRGIVTKRENMAKNTEIV